MEDQNKIDNELPEGTASPSIEDAAVTSGVTPESETEIAPVDPTVTQENGTNTPDEVALWKKWHDFLKTAVEENPEFGDIIAAMSQGMPFLEALARYVDIESLVPPEGAPDYEGYQSARAEFQKSKQANEELSKKIESNQEMSVTTFGELMTEVGAEDADVQKFLSHMDGVLADLADGLMSKEFFLNQWKGLFHDEMMNEKDSEMADAVRDAEISGRNEQIAMKRAGKETGDGLPKLSNTGSESNTPKRPILPSRKEFRV